MEKVRSQMRIWGGRMSGVIGVIVGAVLFGLAGFVVGFSVGYGAKEDEDD